MDIAQWPTGRRSTSRYGRVDRFVAFSSEVDAGSREEKKTR
jgi:hypothetical protein